MRLKEYLRASGTYGEAAALLARFVPDADRDSRAWDDLKAALLATNIKPGSVTPAINPAIPLRDSILAEVNLLLGGFSGQLSGLTGELKAQILTLVETRLNTFSYDLGRVSWRFDANNHIIIDGIGGTTLRVPSLENYNAMTLPLARVVGLNAILSTKANLSEGKHAIGEYREGVFRREWPVSNESQLVTLSGAYQGDVAVMGHQRWLLTGTAPALAANWFNLATGSNVTAVNGKTGAVDLTAQDVGALPVSTTPGQLGAAPAVHTHFASEITDLAAWLPGQVAAGTGVSITEHPQTHKLTFEVSASGLAVDWNDLTGKPAFFPTPWSADGNFPTIWSQIANKPATFPTTAAEVANFDAAARGAIDAALFQGTLGNFSKAAADAVGARIISDTLAVTALGNGQVRLELGPTAGGITVEEADGAPSLHINKLIVPAASLTQVGPGVARLTLAGNGSGGTTEVAYTPKYKREVLVSNPLAYRSEIRANFIIRTAFAQNDGRDIRVYNQAGAQIASAVNNVIFGTNYSDFYVTIVDTLDASSSKTYTAKYGDDYAPERIVSMDALYTALNRPEALASKTLFRSDRARAYRSPNFMQRGQWSKRTGDELQTLPSGGTISLEGGSATQIQHSPGSNPGDPWFTLFGLSNEPGFAVNGWPWGDTVYAPETCLAAVDKPNYYGMSMTFHVLQDGYAWDICFMADDTRIEATLRYQPGGIWSWTFSHAQGQNVQSYGNTILLRVNGLSYNRMSRVGPALTANITRDNPSSWLTVSLIPNNTSTGSVGDETPITT